MSSEELSRTIYAKGFPKTAVVEEDTVRRIFDTFGSLAGETAYIHATDLSLRGGGFQPRGGAGGNASVAVIPGSGGKSVAYWQHVAEEKEKRVKELEEALKAEKENSHKVQ
eukprot:gene11099-18715_t